MGVDLPQAAMSGSDCAVPKTAPAAGLYLHIPFCLRKCHYCAFFSLADRSRLQDFVAGLAAEMALWSDFPHRFDTLYVGGGTPTVLPARDLSGLLASARLQFALSPDTEITVEANPGTIDPESLAALRAAGVTRLSLGVQSFQERNLAFLGRAHSAAEARQAIIWARQSGFDALSIDLINGLPGQTVTQWRTDLEQALSFAPEHLSCYGLTIEAATPLAHQWRAGRLTLPGERLQAAFFDSTRRFLETRGYEHYEIANYARWTGTPGRSHRSRHNQKYWQGVPYLGLGPGAHSFLAPQRWWNVADLEGYLAGVEAGRRPVAGRESLNLAQQVLEAIYLGLRQSDGIDLNRFQKRFGRSLHALCPGLLEELVAEERIILDQQYCKLRPDARLLLDAIAARFVQQNTAV